MKFSLQIHVSAICLSFLLFPLITIATFDDVSLTTDARIVLGNDTLDVSGSTASVASIVVNSSNFEVTLENGSSITVTSSSGRDFATTGGDVTKTCSGGSSTLTVSHSKESSITVRVSVSGSCPSSSSSSTSSVDGGVIPGIIGSKEDNPITSVLTLPADAKTTGVSTEILTTSSQPAISAVFKSRLQIGSVGDDVRRLQKLFSLDGNIYPEGLITGYFGPATQRAVGRFQERHGIAQPLEEGYGTLGPKTRTKIYEIFGEGITVTLPVVNELQRNTFTASLYRGMNHLEIRLLQQVLNRDPETAVALAGDGAPGFETEFFGGKTEDAVKRFQQKYNIATPTDPGFGRVGPKTRAKLKEFIQ